MSVVEDILACGLIAVIRAPIEERLFDWAMAVSKGGIAVLGVPVTLPTVTEVVSDLADEANLIVGVSDIRKPEQLSVAVAAGAELVMSPVADWAIIEQAKMRGLSVIAGAFTASEVHIAFRAGADMVALHPIGALPGGEAYFRQIKSSFPDRPILASGCIGIENAPTFLEVGAAAAIVDTGVFPDTNDPAAVEVITMRAAALTEVCSDVAGVTAGASIDELSGTFDLSSIGALEQAPTHTPEPATPASSSAKPEPASPAPKPPSTWPLPQKNASQKKAEPVSWPIAAPVPTPKEPSTPLDSYDAFDVDVDVE